MAHLHNLRNQNTPFMSRFGEKVKHVAAAVGTAKGIYDVNHIPNWTGSNTND